MAYVYRACSFDESVARRLCPIFMCSFFSQQNEGYEKKNGRLRLKFCMRHDITARLLLHFSAISFFRSSFLGYRWILEHET